MLGYVDYVSFENLDGSYAGVLGYLNAPRKHAKHAKCKTFNHQSLVYGRSINFPPARNQKL